MRLLYDLKVVGVSIFVASQMAQEAPTIAQRRHPRPRGDRETPKTALRLAPKETAAPLESTPH
eukprot:4573673-Pyramimonas_sp.AAC.1